MKKSGILSADRQRLPVSDQRGAVYGACGQQRSCRDDITPAMAEVQKVKQQISDLQSDLGIRIVSAVSAAPDRTGCGRSSRGALRVFRPEPLPIPYHFFSAD